MVQHNETTEPQLILCENSLVPLGDDEIVVESDADTAQRYSVTEYTFANNYETVSLDDTRGFFRFPLHEIGHTLGLGHEVY